MQASSFQSLVTYKSKMAAIAATPKQDGLFAAFVNLSAPQDPGDYNSRQIYLKHMQKPEIMTLATT